MVDIELDEDEEKGVFGLITSEDKLKNLSKSHEDSNANSIDTDDASDIADLSSK